MKNIYYFIKNRFFFQNFPSSRKNHIFQLWVCKPLKTFLLYSMDFQVSKKVTFQLILTKGTAWVTDLASKCQICQFIWKKNSYHHINPNWSVYFVIILMHLLFSNFFMYNLPTILWKLIFNLIFNFFFIKSKFSIFLF